jgi:hypothetical protein
MTVAQAREASLADASASWRVHERRIARALTANDFRWWHVPRMPDKQQNRRMPTDLPDFWAVGITGRANQGRYVHVEAKTGKAVQTPGQLEVWEMFSFVPCVEQFLCYPSNYHLLVEFLGGKEPLT